MPVERLQCSWLYDTAFARDRMMITPHFDVQGVGGDIDNLCSDMADALVTWSGATGEVKVTAYDAEGTAPVYPNGEAIRNEGVVDNTNDPREITLCLSFYAERNVPRQRGRLYCPIPAISAAAGVAIVPTAPQIAKVMALGVICEELGGIDVDWVVWSRADGQARKVTHYWCDNEWDVMRSRGLRATTRSVATTSE